MKCFFSCFLIVILSYSGIFSQNLKTSSTKIMSTINLRDHLDSWKATVQSMQMTSPGGNSYNDFLIAQKQK